ncbi:MAG: peptidylprolyl isomerase [Cytophagaceae bacterium]|nr:peptidylprolyl isomerase [Cytophagaceae bacterium]MBK9510667.1 peptidylprolyl isomerase [Cytophagaceae bacterium]MBK9934324.1 peptidylprolyl isomerase [Cytophagaceae bacterium]MBL0300771.1 peptidylprolyl isomerase [Cytophagaceae bacterium]MBL0327715.1 peptidylprolyl isomerase [Cytophagaceae bacterium]
MVKTGDTVSLHYKGTLNDGTIFDSSEGREPLEFEVGSGMVISGFDNGVLGMAIGEKKSIHLSVEESYGPVNEQAIFKFDRADIPAEIPLAVGETLNMHDGQRPIPVIIREVQDTHVMLDANHPLAGQELNFDLELVSISPAGEIIVDYEDVK